MDLALSQDQQLLVNTARGLLERRCPPERAQALADDPHGFDLSLWKEMAALGWPGLLIPADLGGSGGSAVDVALLAEEMGRACLPGPFIASAVVATRMPLAAGARGRARDLLPQLALGERICTVAALEEDGRLLPEAIAMRVEFGRLVGRKHFVPDAGTATDVIVIGRGPNGMTAAL